MAYKNKVIGFFRRDAFWHKSITVDKQDNSLYIGNKPSEWAVVGLGFKFDYSQGKGLTREQFKLYENWTMQEGNIVIETNSLYNFNKGDNIVIDGTDNTISRIEENIKSKRDIKGRKISKVQIIFAG